MKRDLLFLAEHMVNLLDENRASILAKQHGIKKAKDNDSIGKLFVAFLRRAVVEAGVLLTASRGNASHVLRDAAEFYKVDVAAITTTIKQKFAAKEKAKAAKTATPKPAVKAPTKITKKAAAQRFNSSRRSMRSQPDRLRILVSARPSRPLAWHLHFADASFCAHPTVRSAHQHQY